MKKSVIRKYKIMRFIKQLIFMKHFFDFQPYVDDRFSRGINYFTIPKGKWYTEKLLIPPTMSIIIKGNVTFTESLTFKSGMRITLNG